MRTRVQAHDCVASDAVKRNRLFLCSRIRKRNMADCKIHVVCCDDTPEQFSQLCDLDTDWKSIETLVLSTAEQELPAGEDRGLHNAAPHAEHGRVTYLQQVHRGGFSVFVGPPDQLRETFFGPGSLIAFQDESGPGHASRVGPEGVTRTLRVLRGHLLHDRA